MTELHASLLGDWTPQIGDPTLMGWLTVAGYGVAAVLSFGAYRAARDETGLDPGIRRLWLILTCALLFLGANKQLDLQSALTAIGKSLSISQGWYDNRHSVQIAFIAAIGLLGAGLLSWSLFAARAEIRRMAIVLTGASLLVAFVLIRASSFHHMDRLVSFELASIGLSWILELGGIAITAFGAWRFSRHATAARIS